MPLLRSNLFVAVQPPLACVRIVGRANFSVSVDFKKLMYQLNERGIHEFVLDATECLIMDSTFLGVLAGFATRTNNPAARETPPVIRLVNPNRRIVGMLENLGVAHLFTQAQEAVPSGASYEPVPETGVPLGKAELSRHTLEAHQTLMAIAPENVLRFKEVTRFLEENLKGSKPASGEGEGEAEKPASGV